MVDAEAKYVSLMVPDNNGDREHSNQSSHSDRESHDALEAELILLLRRCSGRTVIHLKRATKSETSPSENWGCKELLAFAQCNKKDCHQGEEPTFKTQSAHHFSRDAGDETAKFDFAKNS